MTLSWQLLKPIQTIIFDCDGTLSRIEGIDELATSNNVAAIVQELTQEVMGKTGMCADIYARRLQLVNATHSAIKKLGEDYIINCTPKARETIALLTSLGKSIYIVSAGIYEAVNIFAKWLGINEKNVFAVKIFFDEYGHYNNFDTTSPLINKNGKNIIVNKLQSNNTRCGYVGDGLNDYEVYSSVARFIGYGGAYYRDNIAKLCKYYINTNSLTPIIPLFLTLDEYEKLNSEQQNLYHEGLTAIQENKVLIQDNLDDS